MIDLDVREFINKRCLMTLTKNPFEDVKEYKILEVAPSGDWVKLMHDGKRFWKLRTNLILVEVLED